MTSITNFINTIVQKLKMRLTASSLVFLTSLTSATALLVPTFFKSSHLQSPIMPFSNTKDDVHIQPSVPLTDILPTHKSLTTFSSFTRLHTSTESLLSDFSSNTTILAPLNSAIDALPRKPWESPDEMETLSGDDGQKKAEGNLKRFVEAHLVTKSPWEQGEKVKTVGGREIWWEERDGGRVVMPDEVKVDKVANQVANGEVWILRGVLNYER